MDVRFAVVLPLGILVGLVDVLDRRVVVIVVVGGHQMCPLLSVR